LAGWKAGVMTAVGADAVRFAAEGEVWCLDLRGF
jgi:hypothetical protein